MTPILYSFRRCPYAMRARLAVAVSGVRVELREILLRDKAAEFLSTSPSATVPCLQDGEAIVDESLDIMLWALQRNDPQDWLAQSEASLALIATADGPFKQALDRTKYHTRYADTDPETERGLAMGFLADLDARLGAQNYLFGETPRLADMAILPFVRQFAFIDKARFDAEVGENLSRWLEAFLTSERFQTIMPKLPVWQASDRPTHLCGSIQSPDA